MRSRSSDLRLSLLALLLALPATVVCEGDTCTECELFQPSLAVYEATFGCEGGDLTVTAGDESDVADDAACSEALEASASDTIDGVAARVDLLVQEGGNALTVTCAYTLGGDLAAPVTCAGTTERPLDLFYSSGNSPISWSIRGYETTLADGADTGSFEAQVFIDCAGGPETQLVFGDAPYATPDLPLNSTQCGVRIEITSAASAAGQTFHSVTLTAYDTSRCTKNADCPSGLRCGGDGFCQDGSEGNACTSSHLPNGSGDCSAAAPHCLMATGLLTSRCTDGTSGDGCAGDFQCSSWCFEYFPGIGICQDGSLGNFCRADDDCLAGCDCVSFGGASKNCVGSCGEPGELGASCEFSADCVPPYGCVETEGQKYCLPCTAASECNAGETCSLGECVPEP